ncbi:epimerase [Bacillus sp. M6-12]|uniref:NAD-dependent epimerase/dehydratase family protein n=1 Tax=Bacillus sp. M6-12 TaxID=2054166 RepID=UPI000C77A849|nr:NAD-dependent epimerase/dehydratase family protein [Bacillus sp. M6-12]PLS14817.1 epimerase [Bacillus sp. M6-12]
MKILVIGGTNFVGRHIVDAAVKNNHKVTMFNRGQSNTDTFPGVERLYGDRDGDLSVLSGRKWDAVIDSCGYFPRVVRQSAEVLKEAVKTYVFISTISVYSDFSKEDIDENSPVSVSEYELPEERTPDNYGPLKVLCEEAVKEVFPGRNVIVRPGFIVGPYDYSDRFTYWVDRVARGGDILAPGEQQSPLQLIDARDMADWIIALLEQGATGTFNATCPKNSYSFEEMLRAGIEGLRSDAKLHWASDNFLDGKVQSFIELPFWIPKSWKTPGYFTVNTDKALNYGLKTRPIKETFIDTWEWSKKRPLGKREAGLDAQKEIDILGKLNV